MSSNARHLCSIEVPVRRSLSAGLLVCACLVSKAASAGPAFEIRLSEEASIFYRPTCETAPGPSMPFVGIAGCEASDTAFGEATLRNTVSCAGMPNGCAVLAEDTIDPSVPYSITEIFDATFDAGYVGGDFGPALVETAGTPRGDVPEPGTILVAGLGLAVSGVRLRTGRASTSFETLKDFLRGTGGK
jgi:hypothetical protein